MSPLLGKALRPGGTIGIVAPASPYATYSDVLRGIAWWEARGYRVKLAENALQRTGWTAGSPEQRASDLMTMFTDPEVDVIQCLRGGYGTAEVLPLLDFQVIADSPRPFIGFSDITALHCALLRFTGMATFYGPSLNIFNPAMPETDFTAQHMLKMLGGETTGDFPRSPDDPFIRALAPGKASGRLVGGCLTDLVHTLGTPWEIDLDGAIFAFEEVNQHCFCLRAGARIDQKGLLENRQDEKGENMSDEDKEQTMRGSLWSSSETAEHWQQDVQRRREDMAEATQRMLEAAGLKPGDHVLDIAAGTGDQSLLAARIVGAGGSILATDISAEMLNIAARVAQQEGLTNITTRVMDAGQLDLEDKAFDAVICRLGLMLMPHPEQALKEIRRVLKPGGKLAALVWSARENNPLFALPLATVSKYAKGASSPGPNPFSLSDPTVFERELTEAGFREVTTRAIPFQSHYASLDAFLQSTASRLTSGVMGQLNQQEQQQMLGEITQALSQFEGPHGLVAGAEFLLGVGSK